MSDTTIKVGDKHHDLRNAMPITLGDWEKLNQLKVMDGENLVINSPSQVIDLLTHMVKKCDKEVTREQIMEIPLKDMNKVTGALAKLMEAENTQLSDPTSGVSLTTLPSSLVATDGQ